jgi:hypothetical protein
MRGQGSGINRPSPLWCHFPPKFGPWTLGAEGQIRVFVLGKPPKNHRQSTNNAQNPLRLYKPCKSGLEIGPADPVRWNRSRSPGESPGDARPLNAGPWPLSMTDAELLTKVEAAIEARLNGDAYEEYNEGPDRFRGASLQTLFNLRDDLKAKLAASGEDGAVFRLAEPFDV